MKPQAVLRFWFKETKPEEQFKKSKRFDAAVRRKFLKTYHEIVRGEHADWRSAPRGRLAEIIVLDQFARNMFRGKPDAFAHDSLALALAQEALRAGADKKVPRGWRLFFYLPFMHSESKQMQKESLRLFRTLGEKRSLFYAKDHKRIIERFGRFPHRNKTLGRKSTAAEKKFMRTHKGF